METYKNGHFHLEGRKAIVREKEAERRIKTLAMIEYHIRKHYLMFT